ncbi:MAG: polymerase, sigma-24 subunit, subfamily [Bryobacterales bacterium]|nr:polymerase, sigma-24 subunit, subfamily [Bryobacterales bacterium]
MPSPKVSDMTGLLNQVRAGNQDAESELAPLIYQELRRLARVAMRGERPNHTLQVTGLVHEAYVRLMRPADQQWTDRAHFFAVAAGAMRRILVDYARTRKADKRGGGVIAISIEWNGPHGPAVHESWDRILDLHDALSALAAQDSRSARVIELRFFAGLDNSEIADLLGISTRTLRRDLEFAQAWLYSRIAGAREKAMSTLPTSSR